MFYKQTGPYNISSPFNTTAEVKGYESLTLTARPLMAPRSSAPRARPTM
jgi:hypothetical protein